MREDKNYDWNTTIALLAIFLKKKYIRYNYTANRYGCITEKYK